MHGGPLHRYVWLFIFLWILPFPSFISLHLFVYDALIHIDSYRQVKKQQQKNTKTQIIPIELLIWWTFINANPDSLSVVSEVRTSFDKSHKQYGSRWLTFGNRCDLSNDQGTNALFCCFILILIETSPPPPPLHLPLVVSPIYQRYRCGHVIGWMQTFSVFFYTSTDLWHIKVKACKWAKWPFRPEVIPV